MSICIAFKQVSFALILMFRKKSQLIYFNQVSQLNDTALKMSVSVYLLLTQLSYLWSSWPSCDIFSQDLNCIFKGMGSARTFLMSFLPVTQKYSVTAASLSEFGVHLAELTVDPNGPLAIRQLASVLLKQYVEVHWCIHSEKFRAPETPTVVS